MSFIRRKNAHPERLIQDQILTWLTYQKECVVLEIDTQGIFDRKTRTFRPKRPNVGSLFVRGVSDLIVLHKHYGVLCIECKSAVGRLSDKQLEFKKAIEAIGYKFYIARSVEDVEKIFLDLQSAKPAL